MHKITIAGFGGQGVMLAGQMFAYAAMTEGKNVSWLPSYGPEMRGGTANCSVIISENPIAAPVIATPTILIAMNGPSLDKFESRVASGGTIIVNSSIVDKKVERTDVRVIYAEANKNAEDFGSVKAANMYLLGVLNAACNIVNTESMNKGINFGFENNAALISLNEKVFVEAQKAV